MSENPLEPNFTQFPNIYFDDYMSLLTGDEWKVLSAFVRKIYGYHKDETGDWIAHSQIMAFTGFSEPTVRKCLDSLQTFGLVVMLKPSDPAKRKGALWNTVKDKDQINFQAMKDRQAKHQTVNASRTEKARTKKGVLSDSTGIVAQQGTGIVAQHPTGIVAQNRTGIVTQHIQKKGLKKDFKENLNNTGAVAVAPAPTFPSVFAEDDLPVERPETEDTDRIPLQPSSLPTESFPPPTAPVHRKSAANKKGDLVDGMMAYAVKPGQMDVSNYPEDVQAIIKAFAETFHLVPPVKQGKGGQYAFWIKEGRELMFACGEFGTSLMPDIAKLYCTSFKDGSPSSPKSVIWAANSASATRRKSQAKPAPIQASSYPTGRPLTEEEKREYRAKHVYGRGGDLFRQPSEVSLNSAVS